MGNLKGPAWVRAETPKENVDTAFNYFKANKKNINGTISLSNNDFLMHVQDLQSHRYGFGTDVGCFSLHYAPGP